MPKRTTITIPDDLLPLYDRYSSEFTVSEVAVEALRRKLRVLDLRANKGELAAKALARLQKDHMTRKERCHAQGKADGMRYAAEQASLEQMEALAHSAEQASEVDWPHLIDGAFFAGADSIEVWWDTTWTQDNLEPPTEAREGLAPYAHGFGSGVLEIFEAVRDALG